MNQRLRLWILTAGSSGSVSFGFYFGLLSLVVVSLTNHSLPMKIWLLRPGWWEKSWGEEPVPVEIEARTAKEAIKKFKLPQNWPGVFVRIGEKVSV
jgi:hypothetical protein